MPSKVNVPASRPNRELDRRAAAGHLRGRQALATAKSAPSCQTSCSLPASPGRPCPRSLAGLICHVPAIRGCACAAGASCLTSCDACEGGAATSAFTVGGAVPAGTSHVERHRHHGGLDACERQQHGHGKRDTGDMAAQSQASRGCARCRAGQHAAFELSWPRHAHHQRRRPIGAQRIGEVEQVAGILRWACSPARSTRSSHASSRSTRSRRATHHAPGWTQSGRTRRPPASV